MGIVKLYDDRNAMEIGGEVFRALLEDREGEILTDREALKYAFMDAAEHLGSTWVGFADVVATAMHADDVVEGRDAVEARQQAVRALAFAFALLGVIWDSSAVIREAEAECHAGADDLREPGAA
jgi:hypothetical protein